MEVDKDTWRPEVADLDCLLLLFAYMPICFWLYNQILRKGGAINSFKADKMDKMEFIFLISLHLVIKNK